MDGIKLAKQGIEWLKTISTQLDTQNVLLQAAVTEQHRTNRALVALLAHQERTNDLLEKIYNRRVIAVKEPQS